MPDSNFKYPNRKVLMEKNDAINKQLLYDKIFLKKPVFKKIIIKQYT